MTIDLDTTLGDLLALKSGGDYDRIPSHVFSALLNYVQKGVYPGGSLADALAMDARSILAMDPSRRPAFDQIILFALNRMPSLSIGNPDVVNMWCKKYGLSGNAQEHTYMLKRGPRHTIK